MTEESKGAMIAVALVAGCLAGAAAVRQSGSISPVGGSYAALEAIDPDAFCAQLAEAAGIEPEAMGPAWSPGSSQAVTCTDPELDVR